MRKYQKDSAPQISLGFSSSKLGFTLIELLVVIAVLGVLAAGLIVIINPLGQMAKARDAGRKSALKQIANALESYFVFNGKYPPLLDAGQETVLAGLTKFKELAGALQLLTSS